MFQKQIVSIKILLVIITGLGGCSQWSTSNLVPTLVPPTTVPLTAVLSTSSPTAMMTPLPSLTSVTTAKPTATVVSTSPIPLQPTVSPTPYFPGLCSYEATFLADVTIPDNTVVQPGTSFVKTWRVRNDGTCTWGSIEFALHRLVFARGDRLGAPDAVSLPPQVYSGGVVDISVPMVAPTQAGIYRSEWMFPLDGASNRGKPPVGVGPNGDQPLSVQIIVE